MPFNSIPYLVFLFVATVVCWLLSPRYRRGFVLVASVLFYASWGLAFVWVPLLVAVIVYIVGTQIQTGRSGAKSWMWLGITSVLLLVFFKYRLFLLEAAAVLWPSAATQSNSLVTAIAFPIGISFYTFEAIAYLVDVRQGRVKMPPFLDLCLFFFFWPNILSGPIVRARELLPQLGFRKAFEPQFVFDGLDRVIWGLVQKNVFANMLGIWVDKGFAPTALSPSTLDAWFLAVAFGLQIYFDFSGYTNIAIGAARLLGVTLPENFRQPYHAATPADFWARWHMTLSRWIRDYLFFPLNAKWRGAPVPLYLSLVGVMALVGLWHGAGWNFVLWGLLHGVYLVAYRMYEGAAAARPELAKSNVALVTWRVLTLACVTVAWVAFRAPNLVKFHIVTASMLYRFSRGASYNGAFYLFTVFLMAFCALEPFLMRELSAVDEEASAQGLSYFRIIGRPVAYLCGLLLFLLFEEDSSQFIYSQF